MQIEVTKTFAYSYHGWDAVEYAEGSIVDVPDECAALAIKEGWAKEPSKAKRKAPETTAADGAPEAK